MDTTDLNPLVEDLEENIDDLEESLAPLLNAALSASTSKLPLLDKAKLYVLTTYAIESLLFSYLRMNGVDAKNHAIFQELTRVKHYFDKLKTAETGPAKPVARLDKNAAGRFIKAGLAGNEEYDRQRKEAQDREKAGAKRKFEDMSERVGSHSRFASTAKKLRAEDGDGDGDGDEDVGVELVQSESVAADEGLEEDEENSSHSKKNKNSKSDGTKKSKRKSKLETTDTISLSNQSNTETIIPKRQKSSKPPRGANEAFQALLNGPLPTEEEGKTKKKRKSRG